MPSPEQIRQYLKAIQALKREAGMAGVTRFFPPDDDVTAVSDWLNGLAYRSSNKGAADADA